MIYLRNISRRAVFKRVVVSWAVFAAVGFGCGFGARCLVSSAAETPDCETAESAFVENTEIRLSGIPEFDLMDIELDESLQEFIYYLAAAYNIDFTFVLAVIEVESSYRIDAVNSTSCGLMQVNSCNEEYITRMLGITDLMDPYNNVQAGLWILHCLFERYEDPGMVLMAYNLGENGAKVLWDQGIFMTSYCEKVFAAQKELSNEKHQKA